MVNELEDRFFRDLCVDAGVAIIAVDDQFRVRFWNVAAEKMFGRSSDEMSGQLITGIVPEERRRLATRLLSRALKQAEKSEFEFRYPRASGNVDYLAVTISPVRDRNDKVAAISVCIRDVTRGMELLRRVAEAQRMSALSSMSGAVAHHFNNFLGGITTAIDFAQNGDDPFLVRRAMNTTVAALARANQLAYSLLAFAEGDRSVSSREPVSEILSRFLADHEQAWKDRGIKVETDFEPIDASLPAHQLIAVLEILAANACEAMPRGGTLRFELRRGKGRHFCLRVCDTGCGIADDMARRVFEPFFSTKRTVEPGGPEHTGMGLAVVYGIVRDLGGNVTLSRGRRGGAVCCVNMPIQADREE